MITILYGRDGTKPLAKQHRLSHGEWETTPYGKATTFDVITFDVTTIDDLAVLLAELEHKPMAAIVRGSLIDPTTTTDVRRLLYPNDDSPAYFEAPKGGLPWVMIDFDKIEAPAGLQPDDRIAFLIGKLPACFHDVTYYYQWSASAGLHGWDYLSAHLWFMLDEPWFCADLQKRFEVGDWQGSDVDLRLFNPVQLHYTARPTFVNCIDPIGATRSGLVRGASDVVVPGVFYYVPPKAPEWKPRDPNAPAYPKLDDYLAKIGPSAYHEPIVKTVAYLYAYGRDPGRTFVKDAIKGAIIGAPRDYLSYSRIDRYLDTIIRRYASKGGL